MKIFLSYNHKDRPSAQEIGSLLLREGIDVWRDEWEINAGESLTDRMDEGLKEVDAFILLMSPASMSSRWVREELRAALHRRAAEEKFAIIPILLAECEIHSLLRDYIYVDWRRDADEAAERLLRAIKQVRGKPDFHPDDPPPRLEYHKVVCKYELRGHRGEFVDVTEKFTGRATRDLPMIERQNYTAGVLVAATCAGFRLERTTINSAIERWTMISVPPIPAGAEFSYELKYTVRGSFLDEQQEITYSIDAPTNELVMIFDFQSASPMTDVAFYHWVGRTRHLEPTPLRDEGQRYVWQKLVPRYKDTYELCFRWTT